ncbi:tRNA adenosine(34) deaminase TadA [Planctomycetota bacterium]
MLEQNHEFYLRAALKEARRALDENEIPIGAVIVFNNQIIARAHNQKERLKDPTAHAEMIALTQAANYLDNWRLLNTTLYVTVEPCAMCASALVQARVNTLVYGTNDSRMGACGSIWNLVRNKHSDHQIEVISNILSDECRELLQKFFRRRRQQKQEII